MATVAVGRSWFRSARAWAGLGAATLVALLPGSALADGILTTQVLTTQKDIPACTTIEKGKLFAEAIKKGDARSFQELLDAGECRIWQKGTKIYLDQSVEGCGLTKIRGICKAVYAYTDKASPHVLIAPLDEAWIRSALPASSPEAIQAMFGKVEELKRATFEQRAAPEVEVATETPIPRPRPKVVSKRGEGNPLEVLARLWRSVTGGGHYARRASFERDDPR